MKILVTCFSQTGNTEKVAEAIYEEVLSQGHEVHLRRIDEIGAHSLSDHDLVFLGSACHSRDLAQPVKQILRDVAPSPSLKLAGFVTHATHMPEGEGGKENAYSEWAARCIVTLKQACQEKQMDFLGYWSCQGAPSPPIEAFIHRTIVTDEDAWQEYVEEVKRHPDEEDLQRARAFARTVLSRFG